MKNDNRIFNALSGLDDSHFRIDEAESFISINPTTEKRKFTKPIKIALSMAAAAAVLGISITAGAAATSGFTKKSGYDRDLKQPLVIFSAANSEGAPSVIEKCYMPTVLPDFGEYVCSPALTDNGTYFSVMYIDQTPENPLINLDILVARQWTKKTFSQEYLDMENVEVHESKVNSCPAYVITEEHYFGYFTSVVWDNGDYIFEVQGYFPEDKAIRIAESVEVNENALEEGGVHIQ